MQYRVQFIDTPEDQDGTKMRDTHRVFKLKDSKQDKEFNLNAKMDSENCLWSLHYDPPAPTPPGLRGRWTSFSQLRSFLEGYYARRHTKIEEIVD